MKVYFFRASSMAMLFLILSLAALMLANAAMAASSVDVHVRTLTRAIVTECISEELPPIEISVTGDAESVSIEGAELPHGVVCRTLDNYAGATADGSLTEYRDGWGLSGMAYSAEVQGLGTKYKLADFADVAPASASGARYIADSKVFMNQDLDPLRYYIEFIRRQQGSVAGVPATIFMVQRQVAGAILIFILDYRDVEG